MIETENPLAISRRGFISLAALGGCTLLLGEELAPAVPSALAALATGTKVSITTIPQDTAIWDNFIQLPSTPSSYAWGSDAKLADAQVKQTNSGSWTSKTFYAPVKSSSSAYSYSNPLTLVWNEVTNIGKRTIDVRVDVTDYAVGANYDTTPNSSYDNDYHQVVRTWSSGELGLGFHYRSTCDVTLKTSVTWHDTGEVVDMPFFMIIYDIDAGGVTRVPYYNESWEPGSGFTGTFYQYPTSYLSIDTTTGKVTHPSTYTGVTSGYEVTQSGDDSYKIAGVLATTSTGQFTQTFHTGNCQTLYLLANQYAILEPPTITLGGITQGKGVDYPVASFGQKGTYTVSQKIGTFYSDTLSCYTSFELTDTLPKGITHVTSKVVDGTGASIAKYGKLTYDKTTRQVKFAFNTGSSSTLWLNNKDNYNGQTISLIITFTVDSYDGTAEKVITDSGESIISGFEQDTDTVSFHVRPYPTLTLGKRILASDVTWEHGNPCFEFDIASSSTTWHRMIEFTQDDKVGDDGYYNATVTLDELPKAQLVITECETSRYAIESIATSDDGSGRSSNDGEKATVNFDYDDVSTATVTFTNVKTNWQDLSDTVSIVNHFGS